MAQKNRVRNGELYRFIADSKGAFVQVSLMYTDLHCIVDLLDFFMQQLACAFFSRGCIPLSARFFSKGCICWMLTACSTGLLGRDIAASADFADPYSPVLVCSPPCTRRLA